MPKVTVYAFTTDDIEADVEDRRPVKATRETISRLAGALLIEASAEEIESSMLDGGGFYRPAKNA